MQKTGGGLYLHNWLHAPNGRLANSGLPAIGQDALSCTCLDDFYIPFSETPEQVVQIPATIQIEFVTVPILSIPFAQKFFHSLRGPPSTIA